MYVQIRAKSEMGLFEAIISDSGCKVRRAKHLGKVAPDHRQWFHGDRLIVRDGERMALYQGRKMVWSTIPAIKIMEVKCKP